MPEPISKTTQTKLGPWTHFTDARGEEGRSYVTRTNRTDWEIRHGWAVVVVLVHAGDDEPDPDAVVAADVTVTPVTPDRLAVFGDVPCVVMGDNPAASRFGVPVENLTFIGPDDQEPDDLATDRWFQHVSQAEGHAEYVRRALRRRGLQVDQ